MKALLIGHGKMGKLIESMAGEFGIEIAGIIEYGDTLSKKNLHGIDVAIDFSSPDHILDRIETVSQEKIPLVIGTTGWDQDMEAAHAIIRKNTSAMLTAANFSFGVALFCKLVKYAAHLFAKFDHYDVALFEQHHRQKKDHPSGTAKNLGKIVLSEMPRKKEVITSCPHGEIDPSHLHITSLRVGHHPGEHTVIFDGPDDTIRLTHSARSRHDFARGALLGAKWIMGKSGSFTMEDLV
jgi:4-hydroxy-tetrahydrodipicolinate reductase